MNNHKVNVKTMGKQSTQVSLDEIKRVEKILEFVGELSEYECICHPSYYTRKLVDPDCMAGQVGSEASELLGKGITCRGIRSQRKGFDEYGHHGENNGPLPMSKPGDKDYQS